jgi:ribonuclease HII
MIFEEIINNKIKIISSKQLSKEDRYKLKDLFFEKNSIENNLLLSISLNRNTDNLNSRINIIEKEIDNVKKKYENIFIEFL